MSIITREVNSVAIGQRAEDGYVSLTKMAQAYDKKINDYLRLDYTNAFLEALSSDTGIPVSQLLEVRKGNTTQFEQGTWGHPQIAINCAQWCSPEFAVLVTRWVFEWMTQGKNPTPQLQPQATLLVQLETEIERGMSQMEQGRSKIWEAVARIQTEQLWKEEGYRNFEDYCKERWGWKKSNVYEIAKAGKITAQLKESGVAPENLPTAVCQIRPLLELEPSQRAEFWQELLEATDHNPTQAALTEVIDRRLDKPKPPEQLLDDAAVLFELRATIDECRILFRRAILGLDRLDVPATQKYLVDAYCRLGDLLHPLFMPIEGEG